LRKTAVTTVLVLAIMLAVAESSRAEVFESPPLVDASRVVPSLVVDMPYATEGNFTGEKLYSRRACLLRPGVAEALAEAQVEFLELGYTLVALDCYRPVSVSKKMWEAGEEHNRKCLEMGDSCERGGCDPSRPDCLWEPLSNYLSRTSKHNTGAAVDVTLARDGERLDMGCDFDSFSPAARTKNASGQTLENRLLLRKIMEKHGFRNYYREWWHFNHRSHSRYGPLDISFEAALEAAVAAE